MMRMLFACALGLAFSNPSFADTELVVDKLGKKIEIAKLTDLDGKPADLGGFKDKKAIAVVLFSFECPVSNGYAVTLAELFKKYEGQGVQFVGICPTDTPAADVKKAVGEFRIPFPVYLDPELAAVDALKATATPEAFLLDHNGILRYRGRVDNAYSARLKKNHTTTEFDLKNAIEDTLAGRPVAKPATATIGCPVFTRESVKKKSTTELTYHKDVLPILQKNCQECHRPGEVGPFALMSYKQAVNWAEDIKGHTQSKQMPPWKPVGGPGYMNDRRMSDTEIATLAKWVDGGTPEGDPKDAPKPREFIEGWKLGQPDLILETPGDFNLGPSGFDMFRCFVLPTNLKEDKFVVAFEVRPGNAAVVHHTLNFFDTTGAGRAKELEEQKKAKPSDQDFGPGYSVTMGVGFIPEQSKAPAGKPAFGAISGWAPGQVPHHLPEGVGYYLPAGADMVVQTHYHRNGKPEKDRLRLGLYFAKGPIDKPFRAGTIQGLKQFWHTIPAGASEYKTHGTVYAHNEALLHSAMPHMHLLGKTVKITMQQPGQDAVTLVDIRDWDYNWQETYWFKEPIKIAKGTRFDVEAVYDNSDRNPNNPSSPPKTVIVGEQTTNEMLFGFLGLTATNGPIIIRPQPVP